MFNQPENAPWWALAALAVLGLIVFGVNTFVRHVWPQNSRDRRVLLERWHRDRAERRQEIDERSRPDR